MKTAIARSLLAPVASALLFLLALTPAFSATSLKTLSGHLTPAWRSLVATGRLPATNELRLAIGVSLRDPAGLQEYLAEVYDPASTNYHRYLTPDELTARFGPTEADYAAVKEFARTNGFIITAEHGNRLLLDVVSPAARVENAFHFKLNQFQHPTEARSFFAPDAEPAVDATLPVADVQGLSDYFRPRPHYHKITSPKATPRNGSAPDGSGNIFGDDFRNAYATGSTNTGAGQIVGLLQFDGYYTNDILAYARAAGGGRTNIVIQKVLLDGYNGVPTTGVNSGNGEVALDIEMSMAMAPGLAKIVVFEAGPSGLQNDVLNSMLTYSNTIHQLSCSWGWSGGPSATTDSIFQMMAVAGQSFFNASGDSDAFVAGSNNDVDNTSQQNAPSSCPYITEVGGTTLTMNGTGASFASETVWNDRTVNANGGNWGSSGGISTYYSIPSWQTNTSMSANSGSTTKRNIPDVALTANNVYSTYDNGSSGSVGGTSCAAPLWAGFMALVNQQAAANGGAPAGFINPAIYGLSHTANYTNYFHDTTTGDNSWSSSGGKFAAVAGYDLATGLGTPGGASLISALAPAGAAAPAITTSPASQTNAYGASLTLTAAASGSAPLAWQWYQNSVSLGGATNASLYLPFLTATNAGSYLAVVTNNYGRATSAVATVTVVLNPAFALSPHGQTLAPGAAATLTCLATGATPLAYQWRLNSNNLAGATGTNYTIASAGAADVGYYDVVATNGYGSATSTVANVSVQLAPNITQSPQSLTLPAGQSATFNVTAGGATPLAYQWRLNSNNLAGATGSNFTIAAVSATDAGYYDVVVTNLYGRATSSPALLTVPSTAAYTGIIAGWDMTGVTGYGTSPLTPTTNAPNVTVGGLTKGSGFTASGTAAAGGWGGNGLTATTDSGAISGGQYVTFSLTPAAGYSLTVSNLSRFDYRRSSSGATTGTLQYSLNGGAYTNIASFSFSVNTSGGASLAATDLSGIPALQNIPPGTNVTFRLLVYGATGSGGNWYIYKRSGTSYTDQFELSGSLAPVVTAQPPVITGQPADVAAYLARPATFTVTASGAAPLTYQWNQNSTPLTDGGSVTGAVTASLSLQNLTTNLAGGYSVVVANAAGSVTSRVAALTVYPLPFLNFSNRAGQFTLTASGAPGNPWVVLETTNLTPPVNWTALQTNTIGTNGLIQYSGSNRPAGSDFFRLQIP